ncbi:MAG: GIY-YIG nuclease family protein [Candidatus Aenigmatarchaeota archaeon]
MKGIYLLLIFLNKNKPIKISNKEMFFSKGFYCYVGSALNNLEKRILRHLKKDKKLHWHIDYFLKEAKIVKIKIFENFKDECALSKKIEKISDNLIKGFGCSDCKCLSHLYYFAKNPWEKLQKIKL